MSMRRFMALLNGLDGTSLFWAMQSKDAEEEASVIDDHDGSYLMRAIGLAS